jgi:2-polyprenyl-3-methyl-5-hydroxy-6-metoxy-1,4-benzoquinol methylase
MNEIIYSAKAGYNTIAQYYDEWKWQKFWKTYEYPIIENWAKKLQIGKVLDAGSGTGNNLNPFLNANHEVTALDISKSMLDICKIKFATYISTGKLECVELDLLNLIENRRKYNWIICNRVLSNIQNIDNIFRIFSSIIKEEGECFLSDVHPLHKYENTNIVLNNDRIVIETYKHPIVKIERLIKQSNFEIVEFKEFCFSDLKDENNIIEFEYLHEQETPIFFYYLLRKN